MNLGAASSSLPERRSILVVISANLHGDVRRVAVQHRRVAVADLARVVHDDDLQAHSQQRVSNRL